MDKKTLYIHAGTHKAGSTTIQSILKNESGELLKEGICNLGRFFQISRTMREMDSYDEKLVKAFQQEIKQKIKHCNLENVHTLVTSNEKFSGHKMHAYKNAPLTARTLRDAFHQFDFDIKIILFIRRQDKYLESMYAQKIKSLSAFSFEEFLNEIEDPKAYHWDKFIDIFADQFGKENIIVRSFDKKHLPEKDSLIQDFGRIIGSTHLKNYNYNTVVNRGYSRDVLEVARIANKHLNREEKKVLRDLFRELNLPKGNNTFFTDQERKELLSNYKKSNERVVEKYFEDGLTELFSTPDYENLDHEYEGLTYESISLIFMKSLLLMEKSLSQDIELNKKMRFTNRIFRKLDKISSTLQSYFKP